MGSTRASEPRALFAKRSVPRPRLKPVWLFDHFCGLHEPRHGKHPSCPWPRAPGDKLRGAPFRGPDRAARRLTHFGPQLSLSSPNFSCFINSRSLRYKNTSTKSSPCTTVASAARVAPASRLLAGPCAPVRCVAGCLVVRLSFHGCCVRRSRLASRPGLCVLTGTAIQLYVLCVWRERSGTYINKHVPVI